jgi:hypothetical protein
MYIVYYILYVYNILNSNTTPMFYSNTILEFLSQYYTSISSIRLFLDNDYGTIIPQAFFKLVLPNISLNMNMLKITNDVL